MKHLILFLALIASSNVTIGQTWTSLNSPDGFKNVRDFTQNSTGVTLYAADEASLLKSIDTGKTWSATASAISGARAVVTKMDNTNIVLVSGATFFKRSVNGGSSWTEVPYYCPNKPYSLASFPVNGDDAKVILLGRKKYNTSYYAIDRSLDSGVSWTKELVASTTILDIAINGGTRTGYAVAAGCPTDGQTVKGLYHTTDYGDNWSSTMTQSQYVGWTAVALYKTSTVDTEWAGTADGKVYVGVFDNTLTQKTNFPSNGDTIRAIRIHPTNRRVVFVATDRTVYKTTDGGGSWNVVTGGMLDSRAYALEMNIGNPSILHSGTRGYIYRSVDGAANWTSSTSTCTRSLPTASVSVLQDKKFAGSGDLTVTFDSTGQSWSQKRLGDSLDMFFTRQSLTFYNNTSHVRYVFHAGASNDSAMVQWSTDSGTTYTEVDAFRTRLTPTVCEGMVVDPGNRAYVYAFGKLKLDQSNLSNHYISTNSGQDWQPAGLVSTDKFNAFWPLGNASPSTILYAGVENSGVRLSTNSGQTWGSPAGISGTIRALAGNPNYPSILYAGGTGGLWMADSADLPNPGFGIMDNSPGVKRILIDPRFTAAGYTSKYLYYIGTDNAVYHSENSGQTSSACTGNLPAGTIVNDIRVDPGDTTKLYIATDRGVYRAQLPTKPASLIQPANGLDSVLTCITLTDPLVFKWSVAVGAESYNVQIDTNSDFSSPEDSSTVYSNEYVKTTNLLLCNATYHWRIRANAPGFGGSPWTSGYSFSTQATQCTPGQLGLPTLVSPSNNATNIALSPTLRWQAVSNAFRYKVEIAGLSPKYTVGAETQLTWPGLAEGTGYDWKVTAINCNASNPVSSQWHFTTCTNCPTGPEGGETVHRDVESETVVKEYTLQQNYPNPFNPRTTFSYGLPGAGHVRLRIFNTLGQTMATLVDEFQGSGWKSVSYDASPLPAGVYFYQLTAGPYTSMKKMTLIK